MAEPEAMVLAFSFRFPISAQFQDKMFPIFGRDVGFVLGFRFGSRHEVGAFLRTLIDLRMRRWFEGGLARAVEWRGVPCSVDLLLFPAENCIKIMGRW